MAASGAFLVGATCHMSPAWQVRDSARLQWVIARERKWSGTAVALNLGAGCRRAGFQQADRRKRLCHSYPTLRRERPPAAALCGAAGLHDRQEWRRSCSGFSGMPASFFAPLLNGPCLLQVWLRKMAAFSDGMTGKANCPRSSSRMPTSTRPHLSAGSTSCGPPFGKVNHWVLEPLTLREDMSPLVVSWTVHTHTHLCVVLGPGAEVMRRS